MTPIDLVQFTHSTKKIPATLLVNAPAKKAEIKSWTILATYFLDFMAISTLSTMVLGFMKLSLTTFMITNSLLENFENIPFASLSMDTLPLFFVSYFFFSYFFNQGQTWGMSVMKTRIDMQEMSFRTSLGWALFSSAVIMTGGISYLFTYKWFQNNHWGEFKNHDHLYSELMQERDLAPVNLVDLTHSFAQDPAIEAAEEHYLKVA